MRFIFVLNLYKRALYWINFQSNNFLRMKNVWQVSKVKNYSELFFSARVQTTLWVNSRTTNERRRGWRCGRRKEENKRASDPMFIKHERGALDSLRCFWIECTAFACAHISLSAFIYLYPAVRLNWVMWSHDAWLKQSPNNPSVGINSPWGFCSAWLETVSEAACYIAAVRRFICIILFSVQRRDKSDAPDSHRSARISLHSQRRLANCRSNARFLIISQQSRASGWESEQQWAATCIVAPSDTHRACTNPPDCTLRRHGMRAIAKSFPGSF